MKYWTHSTRSASFAAPGFFCRTTILRCWAPLTCPLSALRIVHSRVAAAMNFQQGQKGRKVWYRYSDRIIRNERHHWASVNYVHYNPVKHGYVKKATDWPWVSAHEYLEAHGREWLAQIWTAYPVKDYGKAWDD